MTAQNEQRTPRRNVLIGLMAAAASGLAFARQPTASVAPLKPGQLETMIPPQLDTWRFQATSGLVLPAPDALSDRLYDQIVKRVYVAPDMPIVMLLIAYSDRQDGMLQIHRPEICYPVGGFTLSDSRAIDLNAGVAKPVPSRFFTADGPSRTEQVLYWTRIGKDLPREWVDQRWAVVDANLAGQIPDGILVRLSAITPDSQLALKTLESFSTSLFRNVSAPTRRLLIGG